MSERDNSRAGAADEDVGEYRVVLRQCPFRTGAWQCQLWRQAKKRNAMCSMHQRSLRDGVRDMPGMLAILLEEREIERNTKRIEDVLDIENLKWYRLAMWEDGCTSEEALTRVDNYPFHWRHIEDCWHLLTGQPFPRSFAPTPNATPEPQGPPTTEGGLP